MAKRNFKDLLKDINKLTINDTAEIEEILDEEQREFQKSNQKDEWSKQQQKDRRAKREETYKGEPEAKSALPPLRFANHLLHKVMDPVADLGAKYLGMIPVIGPLLGTLFKDLLHGINKLVGTAFRLVSWPLNKIGNSVSKRWDKHKANQKQERINDLDKMSKKLQQLKGPASNQKDMEKSAEAERDRNRENVFSDTKTMEASANMARETSANRARAKSVSVGQPKKDIHFQEQQKRQTVFKKGPEDVYGPLESQKPNMRFLSDRINAADKKMADTLRELREQHKQNGEFKMPTEKGLKTASKCIAVKLIDREMKEQRLENENKGLGIDKPGALEKEFRKAEESQAKGSIEKLTESVMKQLQGKSAKDLEHIMGALAEGKDSRFLDSFKQNVFKEAGKEKALGGKENVLNKTRNRSQSVVNNSKSLNNPMIKGANGGLQL